MFSVEHFIWIGICAAMIALLTTFSVRKKFSFKTAALIMAGISLISELVKLFTHMEFVGENAGEGMVISPDSLPLHLCSLFIFVFFYLPFSKEGRLKGFLVSLTVPVSFIGATLAILMATSGVDFARPYAYQCFLYHAGMLWFSLYLVLTKQVDLGFKAWRVNLLTLFCLAFLMLWINGALQAYDTNFFYVVRPPVDGLPLLNLDNGWYAYFATLVLCGFIGLTAVHLPCMIKEWKAKRK